MKMILYSTDCPRCKVLEKKLGQKKIDFEDKFMCDGGEQVADHFIHCVNRSGHGIETVEGALMDSCNDALMQMSYRIGAENYLNYQSIFGFGLKTGIDLPGEANTSTINLHFA